MPYFSSKKVCYLSISTHRKRVPIATTLIWDIGVGLSRRGQKKNETQTGYQENHAPAAINFITP